MRGTFSNNLPQITFKLWATDSASAKEFTGILDTGFNGYLQIPLTDALPLGLKLVGVESSTIADGSKVAMLICEGNIEICGETIATAVSLQNGNSPILIGTQLLARLGKNFLVDFAAGTFEFKDKPTPKQVKK